MPVLGALAPLSFAPPVRRLTAAGTAAAGAASAVLVGREPCNALQETSDQLEWPNTRLEAYLKSRGFDPGSSTRPQLEIVVRIHDEEYGHTWYRLDCTILYPGGETYVWFSSKRLCHFRQRLHDRLKDAMCPEDYEKLFASAPFARHGGLAGTTKRLSAWCMNLARSANGETFPPQFLVLVLCFIDTPRYIAGALPFCIDRSMERLAYRIEDSGWFVRFNSVQVLPQVADTGDDRAISVLIDMLADKDQHVRSAAVESLSEVVFKDDRSVHQTLSVCMEDPNPLLREAAAQPLPQVAERGDEFVASVLFPHLEDVDARVKKAVKESLKLLGRDDLVSSLRAAGTAKKR